MATINLIGRDFNCVPLDEANFQDDSALYVIIAVKPDGNWDTLDTGGRGCDTPERRALWAQHCTEGSVWVCAQSFASEGERRGFELRLRRSYPPRCG